MRFLKESISTISKEASLFIHEHPKFADQIKEFEEFINIRKTLKFDSELLEFVSQFFKDKLEYHKRHRDANNEWYTVDCYEFDLETPYVEIAEYVIKDNQLYIEGSVVCVGQSYINNDVDKEGPVVSANHDFVIKIPKDVYDIDSYEYDSNESGRYYYREIE